MPQRIKVLSFPEQKESPLGIITVFLILYSVSIYTIQLKNYGAQVQDLLWRTTPADTGGLFGDAKSLCPYGTADLPGKEAARVLRQAEKAAVESNVTISRSWVQLCGLVVKSCAEWERSAEDINRWWGWSWIREPLPRSLFSSDRENHNQQCVTLATWPYLWSGQSRNNFYFPIKMAKVSKITGKKNVQK